MESIKSLMEFLNRSPTAWHAVESTAKALSAAGFTQLYEGDPWSLKPKHGYFAIRNGSSLCAFLTPAKAPTEALIASTHTDSPGFKLKPRPEFRKENMIMLGVEVYGSPLLTSWLNRDLGIAGRISYLDAHGKIKEALVRLDKHPVVIPQLAIHLDRQVNESGLLLNKQEHLSALAALTDEETSSGSYLEKLLLEEIDFSKLLSTDLFLFPLEPATFIGDQQQMIASYRIDSLSSVHAVMTGFGKSNASSEHVLKMATMSDNEEIGSETAQGAGSPFLSHVLERILLSMKMEREEYLRLLSRSLCVSVDLAHALHPNYPERHDPRHPILMQHGIVIKYNSQQRYASDARSAAAIAALCHKNEIPFQEFVSRGDIPCGTTLGPIHAHTTGIPTVDIGSPQLSMHSCREITAVQDYQSMHKLITALMD